MRISNKTVCRWTGSLGVFAILGGSLIASGPPPTPPAPANVSSVGMIGDVHEPGDRLVVAGQVFASDGLTPVAGIIVYAYQTDTTGEYHNDASGVARLHGWAKTDEHGRYEFRTIRPAPYPRRSSAAHIHFHVYGAGYPLQWTPELLFAGDTFLKHEQVEASAALGKFANVQALTKGNDGALHCTFNIRVSSKTNYPNTVTDAKGVRRKAGPAPTVEVTANRSTGLTSSCAGRRRPPRPQGSRAMECHG